VRRAAKTQIDPLRFFCTIDADTDYPGLHSFYPDGLYLLYPASSFHRKGMRPPHIPASASQVAADWGGFVVTRIWKELRYTCGDYVNWLYSWSRLPIWAAMLDYCCENPITLGDPRVVRYRQIKTTLRAWHMFDQYNDAPWAWVPTIQGWNVDEYKLHAREMRPLIEDMLSKYGKNSAFRVGIGTLCNRANASMIRQVIDIVTNELPSVPIHLWGVKLNILSSNVHMPNQVISMDSAAWNGNFYRDRRRNTSSNLSQRQYALSVILPEYLSKLSIHLSVEKQSTFL
jgi:hypothetical protein